MNTITLTNATYTTIYAISDGWDMVYHTDENKPSIAVVYNTRWYFLVRLYQKGQNKYTNMLDLRLVKDFRVPTYQKAIDKANRLIKGL